MPIEAGQSLLHYRLIEKIGEGGMGSVWRALDTTLDRDVAIKVLPELLAQDPDRLARFDREAKLLAALNHPNVAAIYGFHRSAGTSFLAMELVEGEDLAQRLTRGPLPVDETLDIGRQIAEALDAAHERGIVHRDLKPANVKQTPDGKIKVLDFGLAKAMSPESASGTNDPSYSPTLTSAGTQAGVILGTAAYMSPEQARGRTLDRRTDLWSFGCVLQECLTGAQMFRGETVSDSLAAILRKDPDWSDLPKDTPPTIRHLLRRCLTRDPRKRLQDAGDARIELEQAIEEPAADFVSTAEGVVHGGHPALRWLPWVVAAVALAAAVFFAVQRGPVTSEGDGTRRLSIPVPGPTEFGDVAASPPTISPDGRLVVFGVEEGTETRLWLRHMNDFTARPLTGTEGANYTFWSPDSRHVGFFRGGRLERIELSTGREQPIGGAGSSYPRGGSWNARGQIVFAPDSNAGIYLIDASGGQPRLLTTPDPEVPDSSHRWPWFLPDGEHFLFTVWTNDLTAREQHGGVYVSSISGDEQPSRIVSDASNAAYSPSGHLVFARGDNLIALRFDPEELRVSGEPSVIASGVLGNRSNGHNAFSVSDEGTLVYAGGEAFLDSELTWYERDGSVTPTSVEPAPFTSLKLAPGASRAAVVLPGESGDGEIWIVDLARGVRTRLAYGATDHNYPLWSRNGERILYCNQGRGALDFFVRRSDGSGAEEAVFIDDEDKVLFDWSRDGRYVAYWPIGSGSGIAEIWLFDVERQLAEPLIRGGSIYTDARFSPDGRFIGYVSDDPGRREVFVQALGGEHGMTGGARWQLSTAGGERLHWRDDGAEVLYVDPEQRVMAVAIEEQGGKLKLGTPRELFQVAGTIVDGDVTGDHSRLLLATRDGGSSEPLHVILNWPAEIAAGGR